MGSMAIGIIPEIATQGSTTVLMVSVSVWAFYHVFKAVKESKSTSITDIDAIAKSALASLQEERNRVSELYVRLDSISNENHVLRQQMRESDEAHRVEITELKTQIRDLQRELTRLRG